MKNKRILLTISCLLMALSATVFTACEKEKNLDTTDTEITNNAEEESNDSIKVVEAVMKTSDLQGVVKDAEGNFLQGVTVTTGETTVTTNKMGLFAFSTVATVDNRSVIKFSKPGYFSVVRSGVHASEMLMEVVMQPKATIDGVSLTTTFDATTENTLEVGETKVSFPANALVTTTGEVYTGTVEASVLYLDPNNKNFTTMMPGGDMMGVRSDNSESILVSWGMLEVTLTDSKGNKLQIKDGEEADLVFPIPAGMENNPPQTIPFWNFNEATGLWEEEGEVTLQGNVYVGTAKHFSWKNVDSPYTRFTVKGKVTDCNGKPVANVRVSIIDDEKIVRYYNYSNSAGEYFVYIPGDYSATLTVLSRDYSNYAPVVEIPIAAQSAMTTKTQDIELPCVSSVVGKVVNTCGDLLGAYVWYEFMHNGNTVKTNPTWTKTDGEFSFRVPVGTTGKLWVEDLSGNLVSEAITVADVDFDLGEVEICEEYKVVPNLITLTFPNSDTLNIPLNHDIFADIMRSDSGGISQYYFSLSSRCNNCVDYLSGSVSAYDPSITEYQNAYLTVSVGREGVATHYLYSYDVSISVYKKSARVYTIRVAGLGTYYEKRGEGTEVKIFGEFDAYVQEHY